MTNRVVLSECWDCPTNRQDHPNLWETHHDRLSVVYWRNEREVGACKERTSEIVGSNPTPGAFH
jgi:hypothetical protein